MLHFAADVSRVTGPKDDGFRARMLGVISFGYVSMTQSCNAEFLEKMGIITTLAPNKSGATFVIDDDAMENINLIFACEMINWDYLCNTFDANDEEREYWEHHVERVKRRLKIKYIDWFAVCVIYEAVPHVPFEVGYIGVRDFIKSNNCSYKKKCEICIQSNHEALTYCMYGGPRVYY